MIFGSLIEVLYSMLDDENKELSKKYDANNYRIFLGMVHHSYGRMLRNDLGLWNEDTAIVKWFKKEYNLDHADDISSLIIIALLFKDNDELADFVMEKEAERFREHWRNNDE
jgi:hypothetical protein